MSDKGLLSRLYRGSQYRKTTQLKMGKGFE